MSRRVHTEKWTQPCLYPGGARETVTTAQKGNNQIVIKCRRGFIKLALRYGCDLIPAYSFGETNGYDAYEFGAARFHKPFHSFMMAVFGLAGCRLRNVIPMEADVTTVIGAPIRVRQTDSPSEEEISELSQQYQDAMLALWDQYKDQYMTDRTTEMEVVN